MQIHKSCTCIYINVYISTVDGKSAYTWTPLQASNSYRASKVALKWVQTLPNNLDSLKGPMHMPIQYIP